MEEDKASASDMEEDKASTSNDRQVRTERIAKELQTKMKSLTSQQDRDKCCIYRVPNSLRKVNPEAYIPQLISIGPLHHDSEGLKAMKNEKLRYFKEFTERYKMEDKEKITYLVGMIQEKEKDIKVCYSEDLTMIERDDFIEMILLDVVFIIKFMTDILPIETIFDIQEDLMLLENQLPFFIIQEIYYFVTSVDLTLPPFLHLAFFYFGNYTFSEGVETNPRVKGSRHFTDLLKNSMLNGAIQRSFCFNPIKLKYNVILLHKAGVKFQVAQDKCLVNITFKKGVLKIPLLEINYCFERFVRNIMAWEQCDDRVEAYICNYIKFMDHLINSAEDVDFLVKKGIILHWLGDNAAVSDMINKLCENISDTCACYNDICQDLNKHYENPWNHRKTTLKLVYFTNVWRGTATVAAALLLILTLIQAITSVKSVF